MYVVIKTYVLYIIHNHPKLSHLWTVYSWDGTWFDTSCLVSHPSCMCSSFTDPSHENQSSGYFGSGFLITTMAWLASMVILDAFDRKMHTQRMTVYHSGWCINQECLIVWIMDGLYFQIPVFDLCATSSEHRIPDG